MKYFHRIFVVTFLFLISYFLFPYPVNAAGEISSSQNVEYQIFESGRSRVRHNVRLTNLTTNYYASEYSLFLGFTNIENISAFDSYGPIATDVTPSQTGTNIHLVFNEKVVGKGNILSFSLSYDTNEVASRNGRIWEINIPRIKDSPDLGEYTTTLVVPSSFGKATYIKPSIPASLTSLVFHKEDVLRGISVVFGDYQLFDFSLSYHLKNSKLYPIITEIALPPTTAYQEVLLDTLDPMPLTVYQDSDGNWLAKYRLEGAQRLDVKAAGRVKLFHMPQKELAVEQKELDEYLAPKKYWEVVDSAISKKAKELKTPQAIYNYVVDSLRYDFGRIENSLPRAGAASTLANPTSAICMEFTDLFIALTRAAGIPAREVNGFAYTQNSRLRPLSLKQDVLHAWPEYYDREKGVWIAVDPTWGNTSGIEYFDIFDFNHFAFVIKGVDSEYPSPAGSYKDEEDLEKKDVEVKFADDGMFVERRSISIETDLVKKITAGLPIKVNLRLENNGNKLLKSGDLLFTSERLVPETQTIGYSTIPPFGNSMLTTTVRSQSYLDQFKTTFTATFAGEEFSQEVIVLPIYLLYLPWIGGGFLAAGIIFIVTIKIWGVHIQRPKWSNPLRRQGKQPAQPSSKLRSR